MTQDPSPPGERGANRFTFQEIRSMRGFVVALAWIAFGASVGGGIGGCVASGSSNASFVMFFSGVSSGAWSAGVLLVAALALMVLQRFLASKSPDG
jgi:hypothetical protein